MHACIHICTQRFRAALRRSRGLAYADPTRPVGALSLRSTPCTLIREYCTMRDLAPNRVINTIELHANGKTTAWTTRASERTR